MVSKEIITTEEHLNVGDPYVNLAYATIILAAKDFRFFDDAALKQMRIMRSCDLPKEHERHSRALRRHNEAQQELSRIRKFFRSDWAKELCSNVSLILASLEEESREKWLDIN